MIFVNFGATTDAAKGNKSKPIRKSGAKQMGPGRHDGPPYCFSVFSVASQVLISRKITS